MAALLIVVLLHVIYSSPVVSYNRMPPLSPNSVNSRREFLAKTATTFGIASFVSMEDNHAPSSSCSCEACSPKALLFRPAAAQAYFAEVGEEGERSAETAAFNEQARQTSARLEAEGFRLDTREETSALLSNAMSSFSYDSANDNLKKSGRSDSKTSTTTSSSAVQKQK